MLEFFVILGTSSSRNDTHLAILTNISWFFSVYVKRNLSVANQTKGCMYLIYNFDGLQNQLRPIEWCHYIFLNFASHFICFRMFFNWAPYLSVPKYFRYLLRGWIEQISIGTQVRKGVRVNLLWQFKIFEHLLREYFRHEAVSSTDQEAFKDTLKNIIVMLDNIYFSCNTFIRNKWNGDGLLLKFWHFLTKSLKLHIQENKV